MLDALILWLLASILAAAVACYLRAVVFTSRKQDAPWYVVPLITFIVALLLVLAAGVTLPPVAGQLGQAASVLMIAWGGWMLCARV